MPSTQEQLSPTRLRTRQRILRAAVHWARETGLRKLSMDEVARRAGLGRATLYSHFPSREALIDAVVRFELNRFLDGVAAAIAEHDDADDRIVAAFAHAYRTLRGHRLLNAVLRLNPQMLLPYIVGDDTAITIARNWAMGQFRPEDQLAEGLTSQEAAELMIRTIHTLVLAPSSVFDLDTEDGPERYARRFLLPVITGAQAPPHSPVILQLAVKARGRVV